MSSWIPPAAPPVEETDFLCAGQETMLLDVRLIHCLETALEKRREDVSNAEAPMPMGVGTSCFRNADRLDPAAAVREGHDDDDDEIDGTDGDEVTTEISDDVVLGMMEDPDHADGMIDGSDAVSDDDVDDDDDDDDVNLAAFL